MLQKPALRDGLGEGVITHLATITYVDKDLKLTSADETSLFYRQRNVRVIESNYEAATGAEDLKLVDEISETELNVIKAYIKRGNDAKKRLIPKKTLEQKIRAHKERKKVSKFYFFGPTR